MGATLGDSPPGSAGAHAAVLLPQLHGGSAPEGLLCSTWIFTGEIVACYHIMQLPGGSYWQNQKYLRHINWTEF